MLAPDPIAIAQQARASEARADAVVARRMGAYYEAFVGRALTADERRQITAEFIGGHSQSGKSRQAIRELAWEFGIYGTLLRAEKDSPAALSLRHALIEDNYFRPAMQNTLELRLLTEPDRVCVADTRAKRLMTERDVIALANIHHFARSQAAPLHRELSRRQIDELVSRLNRSIGDDKGTLPQFYGDAAAFWAGVRQQWPYFNDQQRTLTRAYANSTFRINMPVEMYASLWGLDRQAASRRWSGDVAARIRGKPDNLPGLGELQATMDSLFTR